MVKLQLKDSKHWKTLIDACNAIITEATVTISSEGLEICAMDAVRVAMMNMKIKKEDFEVFEIPPNETYTLGLNLVDLNKLIKRAGPNDVVTLETDDKREKRALILNIENAETLKTKVLSLNTIDLDSEFVPFEQLMTIPLSNEFEVDVDYLHEAFADAEIYTDGLIFIVKENLVELKSEGTIGEFHYILEKDILTSATLKVPCENTFTIAKLKTLLKISPISKSVVIAFDVDAPMRYSYKLYNNSSFVYFIAPRVNSEQEYTD